MVTALGQTSHSSMAWKLPPRGLASSLGHCNTLQPLNVELMF